MNTINQSELKLSSRNKFVDEQTNRTKDGQTDRQTDRWIQDAFFPTRALKYFPKNPFCNKESLFTRHI